MGNEEIARNELFLLFPQCFQFNQTTVSPSDNIFDIISLFAVELEEPKIGISGKGLKVADRMTYVYARIKTLWEKVKLLVTSFYHTEEESF